MFTYLVTLWRYVCPIAISKSSISKKVSLIFKLIFLLFLRCTLNMHLINVHSFNRLNQKLLFMESIIFRDTIYYIADYNSFLILSPLYEHKMFETLVKRVSKLLNLTSEVTMIDIGAHIGKYAVSLAKIFTKIKIIAIEPNPYNIYVLVKNIRVNNLRNVFPVKVACTDVDEKQRFYISYKSGTGSLKSSWETIMELKIETLTLDALIKELGIQKVNIIKIDVEGFEERVLKGALKTITKHKPTIFLEIFSENYQKVYQTLNKLGYNVQQIEDNNYIAIPHNNNYKYIG